MMSSVRVLLTSLLLASSCHGLPATNSAFGPLDTSLFNDTELLSRRQSSLDGGVQLRILPLGASIVYGLKSSDGNGFRYGLRNQLVYYGNPVNMIGSVTAGTMVDNEVEGWPGYVIDQVAAKAQLSIPSQPNLVLLHVGTNDCVGDIDTANAPTRLGNLIDTLFADIPGVTVIASTLLPNLGVATQYCLNGLNAAIPGVVAQRQAAGKKIIYVDFSSSYFSDADIIPDDGTHPTDAGYLKMAAVWYQGIQVVNEAGWLQPPATVSGVSDTIPPSSNLTTCEKQPGTAVGPITTQVGSGLDDGEYVHNPLQLANIAGYAGNTNPAGLFWADIDGDGIDDYVYVSANTNNGIGVALSQGGGNFGAYTVVSNAVFCNLKGVQWADITGDGRDDLLCVGPDGALSAWQNTAGSDPRAPVFVYLGIVKSSECSQAQVRIGDIDGDGRADYVCVATDGTSLSGWRNGATSNVAPQYWYPMTGVIDGLPATDISMYRFADLNGDGKDDLLHVNPYGQTKTWINQRGYDIGLTPVWESMGITHDGFVDLHTIAFGAYMGSGKADYAAIAPTTGTVLISILNFQNRDSGGTMVKGDGSRYCDMRGTGYDDYIWVSYMGDITIFGNELSPPDWIHYGQIYSVGRIRKEIHFADFDGDGKCDILLVDKATGSTSMLRNNYDGTTFTFTNVGVVSGGAAACTEGYGTAVNDYGVRFADIDGDGRADYLCIKSDGYMSGALNKGLNNLVDQGQLKVSERYERAHIYLADINGDGRADYLYVNMLNGATSAWTNEGPTPVIGSAFTWTPRGIVAYGGAARGSCISFGNLHGQGRADYIVVNPQVNSAITFWNVCDGGSVGPVTPNLPAIPASVPSPRTTIPIITITSQAPTTTITSPPTTTAPTGSASLCHPAEDPDQGIGEYCVCSNYDATLPTLTGTAPCGYSTLPPITSTTAPAGNSGPYTYTDPLGDVIACASSTLTNYVGYAYTQCVSPQTTLSTYTPAPTPTGDGYNPPIQGSACKGYPPTASDGDEGTAITCPPAAYAWTVYVPNWGAANSSNFPMTECGKGFLDNLRGRCGVITDWGCEETGTNTADTYYSFSTIIECQYWDVQDAFKAANGGAEGLECLRTTCGADTSNPLTGGTKGAATALDIILGEIFAALGQI